MPEDATHHETTYFVNDEQQTTAEHELSVGTILTNAGFTPINEYHLTRDRDSYTFTNYEEQVRITENERFTATYIGPHPTSKGE